MRAASQEEPSDRKPDPWPLWMAGHAQLKFVMTECSKTQIRLTRPIYTDEKTMIKARCNRIRILSKTSNGEYIQTPRTTTSHHNTNNAKMARGQLFPADGHHDPKYEHYGITLRTNKNKWTHDDNDDTCKPQHKLLHELGLNSGWLDSQKLHWPCSILDIFVLHVRDCFSKLLSGITYSQIMCMLFSWCIIVNGYKWLH